MTTETIIEEKTTTYRTLKEPPKYKVVVFNDDYTPMEFVVIVLMSIFKHTEASAIKIMMQVHNEGSAVAGVYNYEIAEQKHIEATNLAKESGYPLQVKIDSE